MTAAEKADLIARLERAEQEHRASAEQVTRWADVHWRLIGKANGLALAASYVREIEVTE